MSVGGVPVEELKGDGANFIKEFQAKYNPDAVDPYTPYAAAAAEVLLKAIEASDGSRLVGRGEPAEPGPDRNGSG